MVDRRLMKLVLGKGESQRVRLEAGTTVLLLSGRLVLRGPLAWLAENVVASEQRLCREQPLVIEDGGWIDLLASESVELMLIPPERDIFWRQVGRWLGLLIANEQQAKMTAPPSS